MPFISHDNLICPIDDLPLLYQNGSLYCSNGHRYDIGKPGYANLLSVQHKRSKSPGDSKDMVSARTAFLSKGFYDPIARHLADLIQNDERNEVTLVDAGCGDGYYLETINSLVAKKLYLVGFDISKWAIQRAARRLQGTWLVASNKRIPLADKSADFVLDMFGFPDFDSFKRILKPSGKLLTVTPGEDHLIELREIIYPSVRRTRARQRPDSLVQTSEKSLNYKLGLHKEDIDNLLAMTPHLYRAPRDRLAHLAELDLLEITVDVSIGVLEIV